ncbi:MULTISPECIES: EcoAI/FtnUII family type I restriction enzme subunit R [unclassified Prochlorococcus]|uniref:EcoAI/FtnUII family type I restriction enzme subunit R n=1 Tax=unclassified Prochlorococcus TaxID=2627481 RepID=UPI00097CC4B9|nr:MULTISPECIES: type I restriction endonuclease subunit R [unclassified Prochlorococcus]AQL29943.1 restriction endonuclease subunit R [Prochlorococcus sp. RS50]AQL33117.1 restriction endonuclease subunit R [Prochlorococcus sp. RS01]AQL34379.1 restriction endonuclease subunit R [Prochlorococcus sp. RS04]
MNEADTRAELIDPKLLEAGWKTDSAMCVRVRREYQINDGEIRAGGIRTGKLIADYILEYKNIKLAVIEAKSDELEVGEGVAQAKLYAQKLRIKNSYATNGKEIYEINQESKTEGIVSSFPSPEELWNRTFKETNEWTDRFNAIPFEDNNGTMQARYYQELAVNRVVHAIANNKDRVLLTLATGTGKTFIAFQIAWKLFKSRWTVQRNANRQPRILFLADRNILANQAFLDFGAFEEDALVRINPKDIAKNKEVPKNGSIFFTIFQTFMSGEKDEPYFGQYEKDFFDLVIIDECHRGGANDESSWRDILKHFSSAVHLGLTATPKRNNNADTYKYFGDPVFVYSLKEGIKDGFLTPFKVKRIQTTIDEYQYTNDDEILEGEVEEDRIYEEQDFNRSIVIEERERKRVQELLSVINHDEKTLVFCATQPHAGLIRNLINQESNNKPVDYCVRVTAKDAAIGETYLKQFQDNEKLIPTILTTSRKLSTGVNARNVRNVVLLRPVNNMIEFKQIIGRGTRLFEGKYYFTIIDFVNAYKLFNDPEWDGEPIEPDPPVKRTKKDDGDDKGKDDGGNDSGDDHEDTPKKVRIKLSDGKFREIQSMKSTYFYLDGKPVSPEEFLKNLFEKLKLPDLFKSEFELRTLWANPLTRKELLEKLEKEGCHIDDLKKLQELINAKNSDIFDVLEYIAYSKKPIPRKLRVETNKSKILNLLNENEREFVEYILRNYIDVGEDELDVSKLSTVIRAKYGSISAAQEKLGTAQNIQKTFIDFQQYLYQEIRV